MEGFARRFLRGEWFAMGLVWIIFIYSQLKLFRIYFDISTWRLLREHSNNMIFFATIHLLHQFFLIILISFNSILYFLHQRIKFHICKIFYRASEIPRNFLSWYKTFTKLWWWNLRARSISTKLFSWFDRLTHFT